MRDVSHRSGYDSISAKHQPEQRVPGSLRTAFRSVYFPGGFIGATSSIAVEATVGVLVSHWNVTGGHPAVRDKRNASSVVPDLLENHDLDCYRLCAVPNSLDSANAPGSAV